MTPASPGAAGSVGGVHLRRCVRHPAREAAARCPSCGEFYCRECVVEHEGRLLCAGCLAKLSAGDERRRHRWIVIRRGVAGATGFLALWLVWYAIGATLLNIPPTYHDGTVWKQLLERKDP